MTDALHQPVRRARLEHSTADFAVGEMPSIDLDASQEVDRERIIVADAA